MALKYMCVAVCLAVLSGCEESGLLDYRNRYTGSYRCKVIFESSYVAYDNSCACWGTDENVSEGNAVVTISKADSKDEIKILGKTVSVDKDGYGQDDSHSPYESYTLQLTKSGMIYTETNGSHTSRTTRTYIGTKR